MTEQTSFTKFENEILPAFRMKISKAESTEDVKKFFFQTLRELCVKIFGDTFIVERVDVILTPGTDSCMEISSSLLAREPFARAWKNSDLNRVLERLARAACNRYVHLEKNSEKTNAKIRG